jgi:hypothetical protein
MSQSGSLSTGGNSSQIIPTTGLTGQVLQANTGTNPSWSTATYPSTAGTSGNVLTSNGTNFISSALPTRVTTINGDTGSITGSTVTIFSNIASNATGSTVRFTNSGTTSAFSVVDGNDNILIGRLAGNATQTGNSNVGIGTAALQNLTTGAHNVFIGFGAGNKITGAQQQVGIGYGALGSALTSVLNVAVGNNCLPLSTADVNVAVGANALSLLTTGTNNTVVGHAGFPNLVSGTTNIGIGINAGSTYTTNESSNILIGNIGVIADSHALRIGNQGAGVGQQNTCFIAGITGATVTGTAVLCSSVGQLGTISSSERYKENIEDIPDKVSIMKLRPVKFNYKKDDSKTVKYGLIAEQVEEDFSYLCFYNKEGQPESVNYHELPALLLKEIQRLSKRVEELELKINNK